MMYKIYRKAEELLFAQRSAKYVKASNQHQKHYELHKSMLCKLYRMQVPHLMARVHRSLVPNLQPRGPMWPVGTPADTEVCFPIAL